MNALFFLLQNVANAIGAAISAVGATVDAMQMQSVEKEEGDEERIERVKLNLLQQTRKKAISEAVRKGAVRSEVKIHSEDVTYMANKVRVRVKAVGPLQSGSRNGTMCGTVEDNPHWPFASAEDTEKDLAAGLPSPQVEGMGVCKHAQHGDQISK